MSSAEEKTGECVVCCHRCGAFLMESASTTSYMVCRNAVPALLCA